MNEYNGEPLYKGEDTPSILRPPAFDTVRVMTEWVAHQKGHKTVSVKDMYLTVQLILEICDKSKHEKRERIRTTRKKICIACEEAGERTCKDKREKCAKKLIKIL